MAKLRINGDTSGYVDLTVPAIAGNNSLTLPTFGFGKVLQVISAGTATTASNSTTTYADTLLAATITPSSSNSRIFILAAHNGAYKTSGNATNSIKMTLLRNSTDVGPFIRYAGYTGTASALYIGTLTVAYMDSPATTSAITYKTQFANEIAAASVVLQADNSYSTITLVEIGP